MQKTNHINRVNGNDQVYCYRTDKRVVLDETFWQESCFDCPYLNGSAQGEGVECFYHDGSNRPYVMFEDSVDSYSDAVMQKKKLGVGNTDEEQELGIDAGNEEEKTE